MNFGFFWTSPDADTTLRSDFSYQFAVDRTEQNEFFLEDTTAQLENISERVDREELRVGITLDQKLITNMRGSLSYSYTDVAYEQDLYSDRETHLAVGEANYQYTDKTQPYFRLGIGIDEDEGLEGDAETVFYLAGVRYRPTVKLNLDFGAGYETYTRTPNEGGCAIFC